MAVDLDALLEEAEAKLPSTGGNLDAALKEAEAKLLERTEQLTMLEQLDEAAGAFGSGFNRGLAILLGLPGEIINLAVQGLMPTEKQDVQIPVKTFKPMRVPGIAEARAGFEALGISTQGSERTALTRGLGVAGEIAGTSVMPAAGLLAKGGAAGPGLINQFARTAQAAPGKFALQELAGAGGAAAGITTAEEAGVDSPTGQLLAGLAGAVSATGALSMLANPSVVTKATKRTFMKAAEALEVGVSEKRTLDKAAKQLKKAVSDPAKAQRNLEKHEATVMSEQLTSAQVAHDPGLLSLERSMRRESAQLEGRFLDNATLLNERARNAIATEAPRVPVSKAQGFLVEQRRLLVKRLDERVTQATAIARRKIEAIQPKDMEAESNVLRAQLENAMEDARTAESLKWAVIERKFVFVPMTNVRSRFIEIEAGLTKADKANLEDVLPKSLKKLIFEDLNPSERVGEALGLRRRLLNDMREKRAGKTPSRTLAGNLFKLQEAVLDDLASLAVRAPNQKAAVEDAIAFSKLLNDRFTKGPIGQVLQFERTGAEVTASNETLRALLRPREAGGTRADAVFAAFAGPERGLLPRPLADSKRANEAMQEGIRNLFVEQVVDGKVINPGKHTLFVEKHKPLLKRFPELQAELADASTAQAVADRITASTTRVQSNLRNKATSHAALFLEKQNPDAAIERMLGAAKVRNVSKEIQRQVRRDPTGLAEQGIKRGLIRKLIGQAETGSLDRQGHPVLSGRALKEFLEDNRQVFTTWFKGDQLKRLLTITDRLAIFARSESTPVTKADFEFKNKNLLLESAARIAGVKFGTAVGGHPLAVGTTFSRVGREIAEKLGAGRLREIMEEAIFDRALMTTLLKRIETPQQGRAVERALRLHMIGAGIEVSGIADGGAAGGQF